MKDISSRDPLVDDIAVLIDTAVADPDRAEDVKRQIALRLALRNAGPHPSEDTSTEDEDEAFWDNVPL
jgi:ribosomal protein L1